MHTHDHRLKDASGNRRTVATILLTLLMLLATIPAAVADDDSVSTPDVPLESDDGSLEVGVWWVETYSGSSSTCLGWSNLPATRPDALGLRDKLVAQNYFLFFPYPTPRWTSRFAYGNGAAWEQDWKLQSLGGTNETYVDSVDLAYFAGHGSSSAFYFGCGGAAYDDASLRHQDARGAWGTKDMDWAGIAACNVLDDANRANWAAAMNGLRLIMGFKTVMNDVPHGVEFGNYIRWNYSMTQAWFKAADKLQSQNRVARVLAERDDYFNDTWARHNTNTVVDNTYHWWTHTVGSEPARQVNQAGLADEMPIFQVAPLSLGAAEGKWNQIGNAFGVTDTTIISGATAAGVGYIEQVLADEGLFLSPDYQLEMDANYGLFNYTELDTLWNMSSTVRAADASAVMAISADGARDIAESFLNQNNLNRSDAQFYEVVTDTMTTAEVTKDGGEGGVSAAATERILAEEATNYQVIYSRIISYTPPAQAAGVVEPVEFSVMGPGSKMKIYVATEVPTGLRSAALLQEAVIGGVGGYREIALARAAGTNAPLTTPVLPLAVHEKLFEALEETVTLDHVPLAATSRTIISDTLAYWEGPIGFNQDQLIPVRALTVQATLEDGSQVTYETYIPVNASYMAPLARIDSPTEGTTILPGTTITLTAADASQTLAGLGYDASLDFALGTGDPDSYLYSWYLGEATEDNRIGTGRTIAYTVTSDIIAPDKVEQTIEITLVVEDSLSNSEPNQSTDVFNFNVSTLYLPSIQR